MSEENKDETFGFTPENAGANPESLDSAPETTNYDLGQVEVAVEPTDLLPPAAESFSADSAVDSAEPEVVLEADSTALTNPSEAVFSADPVFESTLPDAAGDVVAETDFSEGEANVEADIFMPASNSSADVPRDVLAHRDLPEAEPTRRAFDFTQLSDSADAASVAAENADFSGGSVQVPELDPVLADLEVTEVEVAAAEQAVDLETTAVTRKAILERAQVEAEEAVSAWKPREDDLPVTESTTELILGDTSVPLVLPSRVAARVWSFFMTLLGAPVAWYLLTDGAARFTLADNSPFKTGHLNYAACIEFTAGMIIAVVLISFLVRSSLGALVSGLLLMVAGTPFLVIPGLTKDFLQPAIDWLTAWNNFGANIAHHLNWTGYTGAIFVSGLMLFVMGVVAILARRDGRREQEIRTQIERYSPESLKRRRK